MDDYEKLNKAREALASQTRFCDCKRAWVWSSQDDEVEEEHLAAVIDAHAYPKIDE